METTVLGFVLGLLLLAIPTYMIYALRLRLVGKFLTSLALMAALVAASGVATYMLVQWNSVLLTVVAGLAMAVAGALLAIRKAKLKLRRLWLPMVCGMVASVLVVGLYALFVVFGVARALDARYFVPLFGLIVGGSIEPCARGLHAYYMGLRHHNRLYLYLLGNGRSHAEATAYFVRRAFQAALVPSMKHMSGMVVMHAPVLLLALIMAGVGVGTAVALQLLLLVMVAAVSCASLFVAIWMGRKYGFDEYGRLRDAGRRSMAAAQSAPASTSSASPSVPRHDDSASLPPEEAPESHRPV